jgi:RND family efflux transporter MFP subunit
VSITGTGRKLAVLRSPIAGTVVARHISAGEAVEAGSTPTYTITDPGSIWVVGQLYQEDLRHVAVGDPATIQSSVLEKPLTGKVIYVGASLDPDTLTIPVRIAAENPAGLLKKGLYVEASITPTHGEKELLVPADAVLRDDDNLPFVYVDAGGGGFARRHVELGEQVGTDFVIRKGLKAGETVVADGALFVQFAESLTR